MTLIYNHIHNLIHYIFPNTTYPSYRKQSNLLVEYIMYLAYRLESRNVIKLIRFIPTSTMFVDLKIILVGSWNVRVVAFDESKEIEL